MRAYRGDRDTGWFESNESRKLLMLNLKFLTMSYIRGGSDYATIQSQAAMLKHLWEQDRKQKELLKKALEIVSIYNLGNPYQHEAINKLMDEIREAIKA